MPAPNRHQLHRKQEFVKRLLDWWTNNKRDFPWRKTKNPYEVLVAEVLLRKTTAEQVKKIYPKFLKKYPSPAALARTSTRNLKNFLMPLGMENRRAGLLRKLGRKIVENHGGAIPSRAEDLLELPGIGRYATNAVLCFSYGEEVPLVDTNIARLIARFFDFKSKKNRLKDDPSLWAFVGSLLPPGRSSELNLAMLDFAARICTATNPKCDKCVVRDICRHQCVRKGKT